MTFPESLYSVAPRSSSKLSLNKQRTLIRLFAKHYDVGVYFFKRESLHPGAGFIRVTYKENGPVYTVYIWGDDTNDLLGTFFHEMGHVHCYRTGKWISYHTHTTYTNPEEYIKALRAFISTGFRAEQWVDRWGQQELKKWFPRLTYGLSYFEKDSRAWYEKNYMKEYREKLKTLTNNLKKNLEST